MINLGFVTINENIPMMNQNKRQKKTRIEIRNRNLKSGKRKAWILERSLFHLPLTGFTLTFWMSQLMVL